MRTHGQDWTVRIMQDGRELSTFKALNSAEVNFGLGVETKSYVGEATDRVTGTNGPVTVSCPFDVDSTAYLSLLDAQRQKNLPNAQRVNLRIDITCSIDFGDGGRSRVAISDATLHDASLSVSGRTDGFTTSSPTFTASTWKRLA